MKTHSRKKIIRIAAIAAVIMLLNNLAFAESCFTYRTKGGDAFQIACYQDTAACANAKTDYQKNPLIEVIGCAPQIYCFTYNPGGKSSACYLDGNQCVAQRNQLAGRSGNVGPCVANTTAGAPKIQTSQQASLLPLPPPRLSGKTPPPSPSIGGASTAGVRTPPPPPPPPSGKTPPPPPPPPALAKKASGRYRVTINGIHVIRPTWDTPLQTDGKGDEVFVMVDISEVNAGSQSIGQTRSIQSMVYGDTNNFPNRIRAGSLSSQGGIRENDDIPGSPPWLRLGSPQPDRFPILVWEGTLVDGQNGVAIIPAIWEEDSTDKFINAINGSGGAIGSTLKPIADAISTSVTATINYRNQMIGLVGGPMVNELNNFLGRIVTASGSNAINTMDSVRNWLGTEAGKIIGVAKDRPIGMVENGSGYVFNPQVITLNYRSAEAVLGPYPLSTRGPGILELHYRDADRLAGDYMLYVQIERI